MRNNIHMNLFASFILRALSVLIKDALLDATKKTSHWSTAVNNEVRVTERFHSNYYRRKMLSFVLFLHWSGVCAYVFGHLKSCVLSFI